MNEVDVRISRAHALDDYRACVDLQQEVWTEVSERVGLGLLAVENQYGGSVLVAEDSAGQVVGFSLALLAQEPAGDPFWWSQMALISRGWQGRGLDFRLKLALRTDALEHGIREIRWAFDPFETVNADLSLRKLGASVSHLGENLDGPASNPLAPLRLGRPADAFLAQWELESSRVANRLSGSAGVILRDLDALVRIFKNTDNRPQSPNLTLEASPLLMEVPVDFEAIVQADPNLAREWMGTVRQTCGHYLEHGYAITDFMLVEEPRAQALYVMEKEGTPIGQE